MKKMFGFWRWIIGASVGLGTVFLMAYQQHAAAEKYKHHRQEYCATRIASAEEKKACIEEGTNASDYLPWGYELLRWPEGVTAWAIIFTGFAIAWQSWETRKSARAAKDAIILQHRPKIVVRSLNLNRDNSGNFAIILAIRNSGSTLAYISETKFHINWIVNGTSSIDSHLETITAITLKPGEVRSFSFTAPKFYIRFEASRKILEENQNQLQTVFLGCIAIFAYTDEIGTRRDTALNRTYDYRKNDFVIWNKEADYSD
jgi:archaellum component FlaG (FlaF/FlaG flagellin family)